MTAASLSLFAVLPRGSHLLRERLLHRLLCYCCAVHPWLSHYTEAVGLRLHAFRTTFRFREGFRFGGAREVVTTAVGRHLASYSSAACVDVCQYAHGRILLGAPTPRCSAKACVRTWIVNAHRIEALV